MAADLAWWQQKIRRMDDRVFGEVVSKHAIQTMDVILARPDTTVRAASLAGLAIELNVLRKFLTRAVATLTRVGLATATLVPPVSVSIDRSRLGRSKNPAQMTRGGVSAAKAVALKEASGNRCACCDTRFHPDELVVDHLVPLSLLGADDPANWVVLAKVHNRSKWDRFARNRLKRYRHERVQQPLGVRFRDGFFWPVINGRPRYRDRSTAAARRRPEVGVRPRGPA